MTIFNNVEVLLKLDNKMYLNNFLYFLTKFLIFFQGYVPQQYGCSEGAYEPGCGSSPTMPQLQHNDHQPTAPQHDLQPLHPQGDPSGPLTPSSSSSSCSSATSHPSFVSPCSDRSNFVSPGPETASTGKSL